MVFLLNSQSLVADLPLVSYTIYVLWDGAESDESSGWYYTDYHPDAEVQYVDKSTEHLKLNQVRWRHSSKGQRPFLSQYKTSPAFPLKKIWHASVLNYGLSSVHIVKGLLLTICQSSPLMMLTISHCYPTLQPTLKFSISYFDQIRVSLMVRRWIVRLLLL